MNKPKKKPEEPVIDFGLSFGGLLKELGDFTKDLVEMVEEGRDEMVKTGEISFDRAKNLKGMYGISVRMGGDGIPKVDTFGRRPRSETREPIVDVFDEGNRLQVIAELPGVDENDITHSVEGSLLTINAGKGERKFHKEIDLGSEVKGKAKTHYTNGILEITFEKA
ncbi:MAG: Hsp20/alpha crystallin family protein [Methanoregulaceae archaeon]|jgi:HSP20 family protein